MSEPRVRVRFAPSPTGLMHLGNVRTALMNYLFAQQKNGSFIVRIEDTDPERNFDPNAKKIIEDFHWLGLTYDEGPEVGGPAAPYFQSQRMEIYQEKLNTLIEKKSVYRCFCTTQELEKKRKRQIAMRTAPRYDRTCLHLSDKQIKENVDAGMPNIWRMELNHSTTITIKDIAHGDITFELKNFSDFPLTRQNGTFTFMFANFVDDMVMEISHVLRGEDHLTNTAGQAALYQAFDVALPMFWHLPILCNIDGKKLSKRDFGFSLQDLKKAGFLPEAISNYLAIIGGSFEQEIIPLEELARVMNFDHAHAKGQIKYDAEKLRWVNRKWIADYDPAKLADVALPFLVQAYPQAEKLKKETVAQLISLVQTDLVTLADVVPILKFYFEAPELKEDAILTSFEQKDLQNIRSIVQEHLALADDADQFLSKTKEQAKKDGISLKLFFSFIRLALMGTPQGPSIHDLFEMLGGQEAKKRITSLACPEKPQ